ncbi:hypothetical protein RDV78_06665 [Bacillota bacterium LX-D]|nr:hypothetical protein [Bacillota bacterium LX-D]
MDLTQLRTLAIVLITGVGFLVILRFVLQAHKHIKILNKTIKNNKEK